MKKHRLISAACILISAFAAIPASGQIYATKVNVPFNFTLENKTYPSGDYIFSAVGDTLFLQLSDGRKVAMATANHVDGQSVGKGGKVVFNCYAGQCFLYEAWIPGQDGRQVLRSRTEVQAASKQQAQRMALLGTTSPQ